MSNDTATLNENPADVQKTQWQRVTFAGLTPGNPLCVTLHTVGTTRSGSVRHFSQTVRVTDGAVAQRLLQLSPGVEIRACIETDWNATDLAVTLNDFCRVESTETLASVPQLLTP